MEQTPARAPGPGRGRILRRFRDAAEVLGVTVVLALCVKTFVVDAVHVPSSSMENTILAGDFLLVNKFIYGPCTPHYMPFTGDGLPVLRLPLGRAPARGDVIVFYAPDGTPPRLYVKRLIGLPGDTVMFRGGALSVNGAGVPLPPGAKPSQRPPPDFGPVVVPASGETLPLRERDANRWEPLVRLEGHVVARSPSGGVLIDGVPRETYTVRENHYFVLGDNRDDSLDSRMWGFVPFDSIVGRAMLVYWSVGARSGIRWTRAGTVIR